MEAKIEAYKEELKGIVNRIEDPIAKDLFRMYFVGDLPLTTMSVITGKPRGTIQFLMKEALKSIGINDTPKKFKNSIISRYLST